MKVRVTVEVRLDATADEVHPDYVAWMIDNALRRWSGADMLASWQIVESTEVTDARPMPAGYETWF